MLYTLHKSLTIAILAISIFISGLSVDFVGAQDTAEDAMASRRSMDPILSLFLIFGGITTEYSLSNKQTRDFAQN